MARATIWERGWRRRRSTARRPFASLIAAATVFGVLGGACSDDRATLEPHEDLVAAMKEGIVVFVVDGASVSAPIDDGVVTIHFDDAPFCLPSIDAPCARTIASIRLRMADFVASGVPFRNPELSSDGPIRAMDYGAGLMIPAKARFSFTVTLPDGTKTGAVPSSFGMTMPLSLEPQQLRLSGGLTGSIGNYRLEAAITATGQTPFTKSP